MSSTGFNMKCFQQLFLLLFVYASEESAIYGFFKQSIIPNYILSCFQLRSLLCLAIRPSGLSLYASRWVIFSNQGSCRPTAKTSYFSPNSFDSLAILFFAITLYKALPLTSLLGLISILYSCVFTIHVPLALHPTSCYVNTLFTTTSGT